MVGQFAGGVNGGTTVERAILPKAVEDGAVVARAVEAGLALWDDELGLGVDALEEIDVVFPVKVGQVLSCRFSWLVDIHGLVHAVGQDDFVCERESPGLHGVSMAKVHVLHLWIGMVGDSVAFRPPDIVLDCLLLYLVIE